MKRPPSPQVRLLAASHKGPGFPGPLSFWGGQSGPHVPLWALRSGIGSTAQLSQASTDPARVARVDCRWAAGADVALSGSGSPIWRLRRPGPGHFSGGDPSVSFFPPAISREPSAWGTGPAVAMWHPVTDPEGVISRGNSPLTEKLVGRTDRGLHREREKPTSIRREPDAPRDGVSGRDRRCDRGSPVTGAIVQCVAGG